MDNQENNEKFDKNNLPETDDGFFTDSPKKEFQRVPAPDKKGKTAKKVWKIVGCIFLAVAIFASGALTFWLSLDKGMRYECSTNYC